ncbi:MAG: molybdenum ABC transporter ATP-binding protein [Hyphomicrobiaceae bacterium]
MIDFDCSLSRGTFNFDVAFKSTAGITGLFGPSGSGKSTVIQLIAGLVRPSRGRIAITGRVLADTARGISLPPHKRGIGLVFQDAQLFPHLSVTQNLTYGRYFTPQPKDTISFEAVVSVLGIGHLLQRSPLTLSGGERQRVAIGRALLASPGLLLMDEPLAALDTNRKLEILPFIERLRDEFTIPILYVSHSVEEIARLATTVIKMEAGTVAAAGAPDAVLGAVVPKAAERFDAISTITGSLQSYDSDFGVSILNHPAGAIVVPGRIDAARGPIRVVLRATNISLASARPEAVSIRTVLKGRVTGIENSGPFALTSIELDGGERIAAYVTRLAIADLELAAGKPVYALVKSVAIDEIGISGLQAASSRAD